MGVQRFGVSVVLKGSFLYGFRDDAIFKVGSWLVLDPGVKQSAPYVEKQLRVSGAWFIPKLFTGVS